MCAVDLNHIKEINYKKVLKRNILGSSFKTHKVQFIAILKLDVSRIDFYDIGASIMDLLFINISYACDKKPIAGVIGANSLRKAF